MALIFVIENGDAEGRLDRAILFNMKQHSMSGIGRGLQPGESADQSSIGKAG
jgi:hypothetical protein